MKISMLMMLGYPPFSLAAAWKIKGQAMEEVPLGKRLHWMTKKSLRAVTDDMVELSAIYMTISPGKEYLFWRPSSIFASMGLDKFIMYIDDVAGRKCSRSWFSLQLGLYG